jgi:hypothetical protein
MVFAINKQLSKCQLPNSLCDKNAPNVVASASLQSNGATEVRKRKKMDYGNEYFHYTGIFSDHETTGCCEYLQA